MRAALTAAEYDRVTRWLRRAAGLAYAEGRRGALEYVVGERLRATGAVTVAAYLDRVETDPVEAQALLDAATIGETHFLRNPPQVHALRSVVLPALLRHAATRGRRVRLWSAGCSTGEEVYSLAMLLAEALPDPRGWDVRVLGTDVSQAALSAAHRGWYGERALQLVDPAARRRWFTRDGRGWSVSAPLRAMVDFERHNLVADPPPLPAAGVDLVLCRNVTIYFDRPTTAAVIRQLTAMLRPGGYLLLGHAETLWRSGSDDGLRLVRLDGAFAYRREASAGSAARVPAARVPDPPRAADDATPPPRSRLGRPPVSTSAEPPRSPAQPGAGRPGEPEVRAALARGEYAEAAALAAAWARSQPLRATPHYLSGLALSTLGRWPEALVALRRATYAEPGHGLAQFLLAGAQARAGQEAASRWCYATAADALAALPADAVLPELDGRRVADLVALCRRLAGDDDLVLASTPGRSGR